MDFTAIFGALTNWISGASTLRCVEYQDGDRHYDDTAFATFILDRVDDVDLLDNSYRLDETNGNVYVADGAVEFGLRVIFIAHSNAPDDFAIHWSELFRARARMQPIMQILNDAGMVLVEVGRSTYFEEVRDQHIYSRAEVDIRMRACVHYETDPGELGPEGPVEQTEVTTDWTKAGGMRLPDSLQLDSERIPPDAPPPPIESALELDPLDYHRADQGLTIFGGDVERWENLSTRGGSDWDLLEAVDRPSFIGADIVDPDRVRFDGSEILRASASTGGLPLVSLFVVVRIVNPSVNGMIWSGAEGAVEIRQTAGGGFVEGRLLPVTIPGNNDDTGVIAAYLLEFDNANDSGALWRNGSEESSTAGATFAGTTLRPAMGRRPTGTLGADIEVFEAGVFDRLLDVSDRVELFDYFSRRYGI